MGGTSSFISLLRLTGFLAAAWFGTKASRLVGVSSIVLEIAVGIVLGPNVLGFVPTDYSVCRAKAISCDMPPDLMVRLTNDDVIEDGLGMVYKQGRCPKDHYIHQFEHEVTANASGDETAVGGHRRLNAVAHYHTIEDCLVKSCKAMVSTQCLLEPSFLTIVGHAGVALMIFESGMHFDFGRAPRVAPQSLIVAILGAGLPLITGALLTMAFGKPFSPDGLAVGTALAPTSIGIALRLLAEAGALQEDFGQATICSAFLDDILSLILLNILFNLEGNFDVMAVVGKPLIGITFLALAMVAAVKVWPTVINKWILPRVPDGHGKVSRKDEVLFFIMISILVLYAAITYLLGTHLWGCFTAGMSFTCIFRDHHAHHVWVRQTKRGTSWMIRIFFSAAVAFSIPISKLLSLEAFWKGTVMGLGPCILAKFLCAPNMGKAKFVIGAAMVGRAEFAYLIAQMAVSADMIDGDTYSIVIWSLLYATIFAPLLFRKLLNRFMAQLRAAQDEEQGAQIANPDGVPSRQVSRQISRQVTGQLGSPVMDYHSEGPCHEQPTVSRQGSRSLSRQVTATGAEGFDGCFGSREVKDLAEGELVEGIALKMNEVADAGSGGGSPHWLLGVAIAACGGGGASARELHDDAGTDIGGYVVPQDCNDVADRSGLVARRHAEVSSSNLSL